MRLAFACFASLLVLTACGGDDTPSESTASTDDVVEIRANEKLVIAGQPSEARINELPKEGVELVVSVNPDAKAPDFDQAAAVKAAGVEYRNIPVSRDTLRDPKVRATVYELFDEIERDGTSTYFHCSTANRAQALWALYHAEKKGMSADDALELYTKPGLAKLEPDVREILGLPAK